MGLRYRRSIKIAPGVKINLNKKSTSVTIGGGGFHKTFSSNGQVTTSINLPVKGLSYTDRKSITSTNRGKKVSAPPVSSVPVYSTITVKSALAPHQKFVKRKGMTSTTNCLRNTISKICNIYWVNFLFPIPSVLFLVLMGVFLKDATFEDGSPITFLYWLVIMSLSFGFFILPFDAIRWFAWGKKKYQKKLLDKTSIFKESESLLNRANFLSTTINTTVDIGVFETSLSELKSILSYLSKYEEYGIFSVSTPNQDLKNLLNCEDAARKALTDRIFNERKKLSID